MDILTEVSLFSGYGGLSLGLRLSGLPTRTICYVEREPYAQRIIKARIADGLLDSAPIWDDIKTFDGRPWAGQVDIVSAGFPCQPHSIAGKREGEQDSKGRNLWPDTLRIIREMGCEWAILENVPGILVGNGQRAPYGGTVVGELAQAGYDCEWGIVSAADAGAPHLRNRWWVMAHSHGG